MQRQSLGSPGRPTQPKTDVVLSSDDTRTSRRESSSSTISSGDDEFKPVKPLRFATSQPEKLIHLIPILLVFCFLVLYLSSHDPSSTDLAQFNVFHHPEKLIDSTDIDEIGGVRREDKLIKGGEIFSVRNLRNLQQEIERDAPESESRSHRKLGDF